MKSIESIWSFTVRNFECVLMCLDKWSLRMNRLPHSGHWNLFSPVCVRRCLCINWTIKWKAMKEMYRNEVTYLQLIGSSESFSTIVPSTNKRPIAGVPAKMSPKMRSFAVHFTTSLMVTNVNFPFILPNSRIIKKSLNLNIFTNFYRTLTAFPLRLCNWDKCMLHDEDVA